MPLEDPLEDHGCCACRRKDSAGGWGGTGYMTAVSKHEGRSHKRGEIVLHATTVPEPQSGGRG